MHALRTWKGAGTPTRASNSSRGPMVQSEDREPCDERRRPKEIGSIGSLKRPCLCRRTGPCGHSSSPWVLAKRKGSTGSSANTRSTVGLPGTRWTEYRPDHTSRHGAMRPGNDEPAPAFTPTLSRSQMRPSGDPGSNEARQRHTEGDSPQACSWNRGPEVSPFTP